MTNFLKMQVHKSYTLLPSKQNTQYYSEKTTGSCSPDIPPSLQVLLNDLHGYSFVKPNLVLTLTGVGLHSDVLFF